LRGHSEQREIVTLDTHDIDDDDDDDDDDVDVMMMMMMMMMTRKFYSKN
jgi:hypothetical protein